MSKTIETHLQSNEVRIPKKSNDFDGSKSAGGGPCQYFKSSFARSLSFSQGPGGPPGGGGVMRGPYGGAEQHFTRSLDFDVNYEPIGGGVDRNGTDGDGGGSHQMMMMMGTPSSASPVYEEEGEGTVSRGESDPDPDAASLGGMSGIETSNGGIVKTLWNYAKGQDIKSANSSPAKRAITLKSNGTLGARKSIEANEIEVLRLRKVSLTPPVPLRKKTLICTTTHLLHEQKSTLLFIVKASKSGHVAYAMETLFNDNN
uniref:Uncharacterized protein n=1 Tax=Anopheles minimus TaxID=112268 RepID=A0A182WCB4_9DIPT